MKSLHIFILVFFSISNCVSTAFAENCRQNVFLKEIAIEDLVASEKGELYIAINNGWQPLSALYFDHGYYYLEVGKSDSASEEDIVIKCPCAGCGRLQTKALLLQRKWKCSKCNQNIFSCSKNKDFDGLPY